MYAASNNQKGVASDAAHHKPETALVFKHAGAVVEVNASANVASTISIQAIYYATLKEEKASFDANTYYTLDKIADFTVNNKYNTLQATWSNVEQAAQVISSCETYPLDGGPISLTIASAQMGNDMIVVPQPKTDFVIKYQITGDDKYYYITAPVEKGKWLMGHKYTYNITLNIFKIEVGESVVAYVDEAAEAISI